MISFTKAPCLAVREALSVQAMTVEGEQVKQDSINEGRRSESGMDASGASGFW
jgi:hypothetical protein